MYFIGRTRETRVIVGALQHGKHVVVSGRFGMGRTSLVRHIARCFQKTWRFVFIDFSRTPADMCRCILQEIFPSSAMPDTMHLHYRTVRYHILNDTPEDPRPHILVFDNVEKVTHQKLLLMKLLAYEKRLLIIAITAEFLPDEQYRQVRVALLNMSRLSLGHLDRKSTQEYFRYYSLRYGFNWSEEKIASLSMRTMGYPLSMKEIVDEEQRKRQHTKTKEYTRADFRS